MFIWCCLSEWKTVGDELSIMATSQELRPSICGLWKIEKSPIFIEFDRRIACLPWLMDFMIYEHEIINDFIYILLSLTFWLFIFIICRIALIIITHSILLLFFLFPFVRLLEWSVVTALVNYERFWFLGSFWIFEKFIPCS